MEKRGLFDQKKQQEMSPAQVLQDLATGNERFCSDNSLQRGLLSELRSQARKFGQFPKAIVLGCMDSRSIPEIIFDQSIADIFTLRIAGNVVNKDVLASMEYAIKYIGTKLIVIVGHTDCAAVQASCQRVQDGNLPHLLDAIYPAVKEVTKDGPCDNTSIVTDIVVQNVDNMMQLVMQGSAMIRDMIAHKKIAMVGALHDLESGRVSFKFRKGLD